jgi:hypothetical protein
MLDQGKPTAHASTYANHAGVGQPQGAAAVVAGAVRPRARARRGQATDPHSIAERVNELISWKYLYEILYL